MKIRVENEYSDGHIVTSELDVAIEEPSDVSNDSAMDDLWFNLRNYGGDGHGASRRDIGLACTITILRATNQDLIGRSDEWFDAPHSRG